MKQIITINLIRHGQTDGNSKKRYIGATDEPLSEEGIAQLKKRKYPNADVWFVSPMKRCLETADVAEHAGVDCLKTGRRIVVPDFRECNFGLFENKNYQELANCPEYQAWIDSNGTLPFPGGEAVEDFKKRCCLAFERMAEQIMEADWHTVNAAVHGGTIMSIMERYARPEKSYYQWHVENGGGYTLLLEEECWTKKKVLYDYKEI